MNGREVIDDGATGVLVPVDDRAAYTRALVGLLSNRERAAEMGRAARAAAAARFERRAVVERYVALYHRVLQRPTSAPGSTPDC